MEKLAENSVDFMKGEVVVLDGNNCKIIKDKVYEKLIDPHDGI